MRVPKNGCQIASDRLWAESGRPPMECFRHGRLLTHLTPHGFLGRLPGQRQRLVLNLAVRQCLLEPPDAFLSDLGAAEVQTPEISQSFELIQPSVGDLREAEIQLLDSGESFQSILAVRVHSSLTHPEIVFLSGRPLATRSRPAERGTRQSSRAGGFGGEKKARPK